MVCIIPACRVTQSMRLNFSLANLAHKPTLPVSPNLNPNAIFTKTMSVTKLIEHVLEEVSIDGSEGIFNILYSSCEIPVIRPFLRLDGGATVVLPDMKFPERKSISIGLEGSYRVSV